MNCPSAVLLPPGLLALAILSALSSALLPHSSMAGSTDGERPNFVLILADDMGWSDIGCYGGEIPTPHIDALAAGGIRFTQFYNTARCSQTRAALLTGLFQHQAGLGILAEPPNQPGPDDAAPGYLRHLNDKCVTIPEVLRLAGYHTYMSGKWHVGYHEQKNWPNQRGFDRFYGLISGASSFFRPRGSRGLTLDNQALPEPTDPDYYTTDAFTDFAIKFIESHSAEDPFFLYLTYTAPHWPLHAREQDIQKFVGKYMEGWDQLRADRWQRQLDMGLVDPSWGLSPRDDGARAWEALTDEQKTNLDYRMAVYAAMVHRMDWNIGRVVKTLKARGQFENTVIIFLSDNGGCAEPYNDLGGGNMSAINDPYAGGMGSKNNPDGGSSYGTGWANASNTPFRRYKTRLFEGGISTPLVISWPRGITHNPGTILHNRGYLTDIMPTFIELAETTYPDRYGDRSEIFPIYSTSLAPIFRQEEREGPEWMFWEHYNERVARQEDWKLIGRIGEDTWELYDLRTDRNEMINLAADHPERVAAMAAAWETWAWEHQVLPRNLGTRK